MTHYFIALVLSLASIFANADQGDSKGGPLVITDPWVMATPPGAQTAAAYLTLKNISHHPLLVVEASSASAQRVEIHKHMVVGGLMKMVKQENFTLSAQETAVFEPGSYHIMLIGLKQHLQLGQSIAIQLTLSSGHKMTVRFPIEFDH